MRVACCKCGAVLGEKCPYKEHREQRLVEMPRSGEGRPKPLWCEHCQRAFLEGTDANGREATSHTYCDECLRQAQAELALETARSAA